MNVKVFVYRNLHKGLWSVKALNGPDRGRVIARMSVVSLTDAEFKVSEAGRQRVIQERRKNVHAGVVGYLGDYPSAAKPRQVTYNPYKGPDFTFVDTGEPVKQADMVVLNDNRQVWSYHG